MVRFTLFNDYTFANGPVGHTWLNTTVPTILYYSFRGEPLRRLDIMTTADLSLRSAFFGFPYGSFAT